ncbi:unnamed protein product [Trypanosoma congolense IL3000]|uniref:WGS project CAEQ00000000 data, annotated contig 1951 n=1 Tax=Trypanosoma congolense (strain IL3000) TaxID=1068625 RepID=F9WAA2_TRYCI|nr:unnamed protein product [Trypanosoma congolense IL3000]
MTRKRGRRVRDEMEGEAVAPVVRTPTRGEVTTATVAAVSYGYAVRPSSTWTLDSVVEDVLMERYSRLNGMRLHDFLMEHFSETFGSPSVSTSVFMDDPSLCVSDDSVLRWITNSSPYREFVEEYKMEYEICKAMREGVDRLSARGIFSLRQWARADAANEVKGITLRVKGMLNAALYRVRRNEEAMRHVYAHSVKELDGVYDSVFNARWSYVVRSDEYSKKWLGMSVLRVGEGEQPHLWSKAQADIKPDPDPEEPWEGDVVPGVEGKLVMAVLSSQKGWPYGFFQRDDVPEEKVDMLTGYDAVGDAYVRKENLRVWHIVQENIDAWSSGVGDVHPFIVIGTPGIGNSFATGSLLLYQLLHYPSEDLNVVAYFVRGKAYLFHREERRVVHYAEEEISRCEVEGMARRGVKGYMIYDNSDNGIDISVGSCRSSWGIVLISPPNVKVFHEFTKQLQHTLPIYINCYEDVELKAVLVWERQSQLQNNQIKLENVNLGND